MNQTASKALLKMEAVYSSETSVDFHRNTRRFKLADITQHSHFCQILTSNMSLYDSTYYYYYYVEVTQSSICCELLVQQSVFSFTS
jgi:hypothetical protein